MRRPRTAVHGGARAERGAHKPTHIAQGMQIPAAPIQHRHPIARRAGGTLEIGALEQLDRGAAPRELLRSGAHPCRMFRP